MTIDLGQLDSAISAATTETASFVALFKTQNDQLQKELAGDADAQAKVAAYFNTLTANTQMMVDAANANVPPVTTASRKP